MRRLQRDVLEFSLLPQPSLSEMSWKHRRKQWLEKREAELLPCDYFHAVATVPSELHDVFRREQKFMYGLLMKVSAEAVKELCAKKRHLGALPGILSVLHTWNGELRFHPHVHMLITGGGITQDGEHFEPARGKFLVPVAVLSRKIAAKFRDALKKEKPSLFATIPASVWHREWVSFCKHYGHGNDAVLELPVAVCLPDGDQQCTDSRHGRHARDVPLQGPQQRHLADRPAARRRVPAAFSAARPAARFSQGPLLRTVAPFQARLGEPGLAALDPGEADRRSPPAEDRGPARRLETNSRVSRQPTLARRGS